MIAVTTIDNIGLGTLQPGRGFSLYPVKYKVSKLGGCRTGRAYSLLMRANKLKTATVQPPIMNSFSRLLPMSYFTVLCVFSVDFVYLFPRR